MNDCNHHWHNTKHVDDSGRHKCGEPFEVTEYISWCCNCDKKYNTKTGMWTSPVPDYGVGIEYGNWVNRLLRWIGWH